MSERNIISGSTEDEVWQQIRAQMSSNEDLLYYDVVVMQGNRKIEINVDIDLGGGFESGYETTTITAPLQTVPAFKFAIHEEHFTDEIGKFFGMQDVVIGYEEFDKKFVIKTNNADKVKELFSDPELRLTLESYSDFSLGIAHDKSEDKDETYSLEFMTEEGITDPDELRIIYNAFYTILNKIDPL